MKNLIKISLIAVTFLAVSCNKEVIKPNNTSNEEVIVMKSTTYKNPDSGRSADNSGITDPNNDPDFNIKKTNIIKQN
ncbi:MAG: hypothetical protein PHQ74_02880 [Crocinitomicaceae bacterium]|nr:hypothetical protein [Crocinitomicaceae bacterium]